MFFLVTYPPPLPPRIYHRRWDYIDFKGSGTVAVNQWNQSHTRVGGWAMQSGLFDGAWMETKNGMTTTEATQYASQLKDCEGFSYYSAGVAPPVTAPSALRCVQTFRGLAASQTLEQARHMQGPGLHLFWAVHPDEGNRSLHVAVFKL